MDRMGRIAIQDDSANQLANFRGVILEKHPPLGHLEVLHIAAEIDAIFDRRSGGGESFDESFWTNAGFERHEDWLKIRAMARRFLIR